MSSQIPQEQSIQAKKRMQVHKLLPIKVTHSNLEQRRIHFQQRKSDDEKKRGQKNSGLFPWLSNSHYYDNDDERVVNGESAALAFSCGQARKSPLTKNLHTIYEMTLFVNITSLFTKDLPKKGMLPCAVGTTTLRSNQLIFSLKATTHTNKHYQRRLPCISFLQQSD